MEKKRIYARKPTKKNFPLPIVIIAIILMICSLVFILIINRSNDDSNNSFPSPSPTSSPSQPSPEDKPVDLSEDMRFCNSASDCVPVDCGCSCSGCGGFSYQDVVNTLHVNQWYQEKNCEKSKICPQVCCPERRIACENHVCVVIELST